MTANGVEAPKILAFSGSARGDSFNHQLIENAARMAEEAGAEVRLINLGDFPMPIMNQDLERNEGQPKNGTRLKELFIRSDGLLISAPEYNSSITPLLKNAIDWVSRRVGDEPPLVGYKHKVVALLSASPGRLGGLRGLVHLRSILSYLGAIVLPEQHAISSASDAFDGDRKLARESDINRVRSVVNEFVHFTSKLS